MVDPWLSVVTVSRNHRDGLARTLGSVRSQTFGDWESVVVDGGSTDGTPAMLAALGDDEPRLRWDSSADEGPYDAMNKGLARARGSLVLFLNAGDALADAGALDRVQHHWEDNRWRAGYAQYRERSGSRWRVHPQHPVAPADVSSGATFFPHPSSFVERELLQAVGGFDLRFRVAADQELLLRVSDAAPLVFLPFVVTEFEAGGISRRQPGRERVAEFAAIRRSRGEQVGGTRVTELVWTAWRGRVRSPVGDLRRTWLERRRPPAR